MTDLERAAAGMICIGFDGMAVPHTLRELLHRGVSSVILFARNYESPAQLADLCREIKDAVDRPILICIDQEGGRVQRLRDPFTRVPSMREIGLREPLAIAEAEARRIGRIMAHELSAVGIDMNLAPVLDVDSNPDNPVIGERSFSSDPQRVAQLGCALIEGLQSNGDGRGIAACGKHFPGHGDTAIDSHLDLPRLKHDIERLKVIELPPFAAAVRADVAAIMTSHVLFEPLDPDLPASMSEPIVTGLLRERLGFEGLVMSDDLEMQAIANHFGIPEAVIRGAGAGVDLFPVCHQVGRQHEAIDALIRAVERGAVNRARLERANERLHRICMRYVRSAKPSERRLALPS